jgi:hypothetical protein
VREVARVEIVEEMCKSERGGTLIGSRFTHLTVGSIEAIAGIDWR